MTIINFSMHIYQSTDSNCKFLYDTILNELNIQGSAGFILVILKCGILISVWIRRVVSQRIQNWKSHTNLYNLSGFLKRRQICRPSSPGQTGSMSDVGPLFIEVSEPSIYGSCLCRPLAVVFYSLVSLC